MTSANGELPAAPGSRLQLAALAVALAASAAFVMYALPNPLVTWDTVPCLLVGILLCVAFRMILGLSRAPAQSTKRLTWFLWWVLLSSEEYFIRWNETSETLGGNFSPAAFFEAGMWILVFAGMLVIAMRDRGSLGPVFERPYRWLTAFGLVSLLSSVYAAQHMFSLAWGFKLCVVILLLAMCAGQIEQPQDLLTFLKVTLWGVAFLTIEPLIRALLTPEPMFVDGRLGNVISPTGISAIAACLLLMSIMVSRVTHDARWMLLAIAGAGIMILGGGKTAIVAGVLAGMLFFALQRKVGAAVLLFIAILLIGGVMVATTPLSGYLQNYVETENISTLTGRTGLWDLALPAILQNPILGHGYATSRFIGYALEGNFDAGHTHNGFLEALYNNGLVGLVLLLLIHIVIVRGIYRIVRHPNLSADALQVGVGCAAIYLNILINGMFNASFGGRAGGTFVLMLALVVITERLLVFLRRESTIHPELIHSYSDV
jgi:O-Antigen ligase